MAASAKLRADKAYQRLRALRPKKVAALVDGEPRPLALRNGRSKWDGVLTAARAMGAEAIECLDDEDAILEIIILNPLKHSERTELAEVEPEEPLASVPMSERAAEVRSLVALCLDAADRSVGRQENHVGQVLEASIQVMKAAADRAERGERALDKVLRAHHRLLMSQTEAGDEDDGIGRTSDMMAMMAAMMHGDRSALAKFGAGAAGGNGATVNEDGEVMVQVPKSLVDKALIAMKRMEVIDNAAAAAAAEETEEGDPA